MNKSPSSDKALDALDGVALFESSEGYEAIISNIVFSLIQITEIIEENDTSIPRFFTKKRREVSSRCYWSESNGPSMTTLGSGSVMLCLSKAAQIATAKGRESHVLQKPIASSSRCSRCNRVDFPDAQGPVRSRYVTALRYGVQTNQGFILSSRIHIASCIHFILSDCPVDGPPSPSRSAFLLCFSIVLCRRRSRVFSGS